MNSIYGLLTVPWKEKGNRIENYITSTETRERETMWAKSSRWIKLCAITTLQVWNGSDGKLVLLVTLTRHGSRVSPVVVLRQHRSGYPSAVQTSDESKRGLVSCIRTLNHIHVSQGMPLVRAWSVSWWSSHFYWLKLILPGWRVFKTIHVFYPWPRTTPFALFF